MRRYFKMKAKNLLQINSSGRFEGSITRQLSDLLVKQIRENQPELQLVQRDLATGLPFIDEQWIGANFTPNEQRSEVHKEALSFSDQLVNELQQAETIIIASPIYNFSIPAVLKAWIDLVARAQLTFRYTENGAEGLLKGKKAYVVVASGGVPIGSEMDFASSYLKQVLAFIGITEVTIVDASKINLLGDDNNHSAEKQLETVI
jgi:FMN-dependent NADH-azoreductase